MDENPYKAPEDKGRLLLAAALSAALCMPVGGFFFGFVGALGSVQRDLNPLGAGIMGVILTPLFLGFPPAIDTGHRETANAWPYIVPAAIVLFVIFVALGRRKRPPR